jgi:ribokinase
MGRPILVCGLINLETTLRVEGFPLAYAPVRYPFFGVRSAVAGVGYNIARALTVLGDEARLLSIIGSDPAGELVGQQLAQDGIPAGFIVRAATETAQSVILYDGEGRRAIHTDLKDIQQQPYPAELFAAALPGAAIAVLANINFSRPFLALARRAGAPVATDVHTIRDLEDGYNQDYLAAADILFMSDEALPCPPEEWARRVLERYPAEIVVIGLGAAGALLAVRRHHFLERVPAVVTRPVVSTVGAGDALFAAFVHFYSATADPYAALAKATYFASYKIGDAGAAEGFLTEEELERRMAS